MNTRSSRGLAAVWCAVVFVLVPGLCAQEAVGPAHTGVTQDWSERHIVFSRDALARQPELLYREPRILHQATQRWQVPRPDVFQSADPLANAADNSGHRDWKVVLGGRLAPNAFPAKFTFDPAAPADCANDYVVFGLAAVGTPNGRPNLVAFNNLYSGSSPTGLCGSAPSVLFAYNITTLPGGKIVTSPILSEDGTKVAFVESVGNAAIFHVLTWTAGQGTLAAAAPPTMTSLTFTSTSNCTSSAPWIDYSGDIVYVGSDKGLMYKITGVFRGTPTLAGSPWPVTVSTNFHLTPPVLDAGLGKLMVGSANGSLYQINTATGALSALAVGQKGGTSPGIVAPPIVDVTNGTTFVVSANDGTTAVLVQVDTETLGLMAKARIGLGSHGGTVLNLYEPAFTNQYYNDPSSGNIRLCGTAVDTTAPWQYAFGFTGRMMRTTVSFSQQLLTSLDARCTGWTEIFNPNVNGGTDFFFFGLTQDCTAPGTGFADGCVVARSSNTTINTVTVDGGPSGIVVDNYSAAPQAASIYLTAGRLNAAYKFTQNGLQ